MYLSVLWSNCGILQVCACENCLAAINDDGSVLLWKNEWRTLHFQKDHLSERPERNFAGNNANYKEKKNTSLDIVKPELNEVVCENKRSAKEEISSSVEMSNKVEFKSQEIGNKRLKVEVITEKKDKDKSDSETIKVSFSKVAVEDNLLLALDTSKTKLTTRSFKFTVIYIHHHHL